MHVDQHEERPDLISRAIEELCEVVSTLRLLQSGKSKLPPREILRGGFAARLDRALSLVSEYDSLETSARAWVDHPESSKRMRIIERMSLPQGVLISALELELGWARGTLSSVITGLRRDGYVIKRFRMQGEKRSRYRIVGKSLEDQRRS